MAESKADNLPKVISVLDLLTEEELVHLNHVIVSRLNLMRQIRSQGKMVNFRIGQRVKFITAEGQLIRGTVARHNRKSVSIVTDTGHQWRVAPDFLQPEN